MRLSDYSLLQRLLLISVRMIKGALLKCSLAMLETVPVFKYSWDQSHFNRSPSFSPIRPRRAFYNVNESAASHLGQALHTCMEWLSHSWGYPVLKKWPTSLGSWSSELPSQGCLIQPIDVSQVKRLTKCLIMPLTLVAWLYTAGDAGRIATECCHLELESYRAHPIPA